MEFHQNLQTHSYDCFPAGGGGGGGGGGVSLLPLFFIVVVIPGHNLGNSQVSVNRTIGPTLVIQFLNRIS